MQNSMPKPAPIAYAPPDAEVRPAHLHYLRVLAYCYWVFAAMTTLGGVMVCIAVPQTDARLAGAGMITFGVMSAVAGAFLYTPRYPWFSLCVGAAALFVFPLGTLLGIATIGLLSRRNVAHAFRKASNQPPADAAMHG